MTCAMLHVAQFLSRRCNIIMLIIYTLILLEPSSSMVSVQREERLSILVSLF